MLSYYTFHTFLSFFFQAEDGIRDLTVTGVQTCALPISLLQHRVLVDVEQPEAVSRRVHLEAVAPRSHVARDREGGERRSVGRGLRLEVEPPLPHDIVQHDVGPQEVQPTGRRP